LEKLE